MRLWFLLAVVALTALSCQAADRWVSTAVATPLVFKPDQLPEARVGEKYEVKITVENTLTPVNQFGVKKDELPPGLTLVKQAGEESTAILSGTPTQPGTYKFIVHASCYGTQRSGQEGDKEYTIVVK